MLPCLMANYVCIFIMSPLAGQSILHPSMIPTQQRSWDFGLPSEEDRVRVLRLLIFKLDKSSTIQYTLIDLVGNL